MLGGDDPNGEMSERVVRGKELSSNKNVFMELNSSNESLQEKRKR